MALELQEPRTNFPDLIKWQGKLSIDADAVSGAKASVDLSTISESLSGGIELFAEGSAANDYDLVFVTGFTVETVSLGVGSIDIAAPDNTYYISIIPGDELSHKYGEDASGNKHLIVYFVPGTTTIILLKSEIGKAQNESGSKIGYAGTSSPTTILDYDDAVGPTQISTAATGDNAYHVWDGTEDLTIYAVDGADLGETTVGNSISSRGVFNANPAGLGAIDGTYASGDAGSVDFSGGVDEVVPTPSIDSYDNRTTVTRASAGVFNITLPKKWGELIHSQLTLEQASFDGSMNCVTTSYTASTGVLVVTHSDGGSAADPAADDPIHIYLKLKER